MKMEGDPHVTAWGVMRGQALDLITPQQVVGGLFLMNAEEKACMALQPRLEILDEQGELMSAPHPLLSQHDEPSPGAGEGQPPGVGSCQSLCATAKPWMGEEDGRLTLCTLNLVAPSPIYKPSMDDQMPPLIIVPPENAHLPLCPAPFSEESEQNLEVNIPHRDPLLGDYLLDVRSLFNPDHNSDQDAHSDSLVSALDSYQVPETMNSLSADLQFTSDMRQGDEVPATNDQNTHVESCLPLQTDQSCSVRPLLDPDVEHLPLCNPNHSLPQLELSLAQLLQSEALVENSPNDQMPQSEPSQLSQCTPCMVPDPIQLPQPDSNKEPDHKKLPLTELFVDTKITSCLATNSEQLPHTEPNLDLEQLPHTEPNLDPGTERLAHSEPNLYAGPEPLPQTEENLDPDPEQLPQTEPNLVPDQFHHTEPNLYPDLEQMPQTEINLDPEPEQFPQTEANLDFDLEQLLQTDSKLDPSPELLPHTETALNPDPEQLSNPIVESEDLSLPYLHYNTDQLSQSDTQIDLNPEQYSLTESFVTKELSPTIFHLNADAEKVAKSEPYFDPVSDHLYQYDMDSCLTPDHDLPGLSETSTDLCIEAKLLSSSDISMTSDLLPHSGPCLEPTNSLPLCEQLSSNENLPHPQPFRDYDVNPLEYFCSEITNSESHLGTYEPSELDPPIDYCLDSDIEICNLAESFMAHDAEQSIEALSSLVPTTDQLTQPNVFSELNLTELNPSNMHLEGVPHPESDKVPSNDPLPSYNLSLVPDQIPNSGSILDPDLDQLPWFELSMCSNTAHLPFSTHNLNGGETSVAYEADELSLCDPFLAPDHYDLPVSKSPAEQLTLGDTYLEPPICESSSDMGHRTTPGQLMGPKLGNLQQSDAFFTPDPKNVLQSESLSHQDNDQLTEPCLDNDQLPKVEHIIDSDNVLVPAPSGNLDVDQLPGLESTLTNNCMELYGRPEFEPCLTMDDDVFFLSDTFLAHDMDQFHVLDHSMTLESDPLPLPNDDQTEPCSPLDYDRFPEPDACLSPDNQLPLSECPLSAHSDQLESCSSSNIDHLPKTKFCMPPEYNSDYLDQSEPHVVADGYQFTLEPYLKLNIDQLPQLESNLCQENEHLSGSEYSLCLDDDNFSLLDASLGSDQLSDESPLYPSSDQLAQTDSHLDSSSDLLPHPETHLGLESDELSHCESHSEYLCEVPHTGHMNQIESVFNQDINHFPLSASQKAPKTAQPNDCEPYSTPDLDTFCCIERPLTESSLTQDTDSFPCESFVTPVLDMSHLPGSSVVPTTREIFFSESLLVPSIDHFKLLESSSTSQLPTIEPSFLQHPKHMPSIGHSTSSESSESLTVSHFLPSQTSGNLSGTNVSLYDSNLNPTAPSNTNLPNRTPEELLYPWDWTLHSIDLSEVSVCGEPIQSSGKQLEPEDCFTIFCLDNPLDSSHTTPEADLALSDDLLSLCDVFAHLQTDDTLSSQSDQSPISTNGLTDYSVEGDQFFETVDQKDIESNSPSKPCTFHSANPPLDHGFLNFKSDQSDSYCLDLLFEPTRIDQELEGLSNEPLLQPDPRKTTEDVVDSTRSDPSWLRSETQTCKNGSALVEKSLTANYLDDSLLSHSDALLISSRFDQSSPQDTGSLQSPIESTQVPVIVVTDPLELLSASDDHPDNILAKSPNALPSDMSASAELDLDADLQVMEVPSCENKELPEHKLDQLLSDCLDSSELPLRDGLAPLHRPQSDAILGTALPAFIPAGELQLTRTGSPFENIKLRSRDSQDSAPVLMPFGEGDPLLAFSLDSDSPCAGDELARLRAVFDALDRDKDGFVKMEDFVQFATVYGAEQVKYLTGYLDPAGLGVINFRDFYRGISEIQNEDLDMQLYDMGYPSEEEPACSVDFDDLAAFEVTEVTDSAYVGSESAYSECETFTDEDTGGLAAQEDPETEGDGAASRGHAPATPEGLELSLCDISGVTVTGQEEQFEDFGEGAEPDLFNSHCEEEQESFTQTTNTSQRLTSSGAPVSERQLLAPPPCTGLGGLYCSQCHKHINRLEDLSSRLRHLEMDSPDKRPSSRKEARRLHHSGFLGEDQGEQPLANMSCDDTDLTDKVLYLEQRVSELERDAAMTGEQQNRLRQENLHLLHRAHALEEQLKDQEERSDEVQSEETRKHRDELRKMERDRGFRLSSLKARVQELENENVELRSQLPSAKATSQRLEEEKHKLLDQVEELQRQLKDNQDQNKKLGGKLSKEKHKQQQEKERCQEVIEELRRELEQTQLLRLEMEQRMGLGNSAALQEYNSRTKEAELEQEVRRLKQEQRILKEQNEELNGQIINLSIQGAKNLFSTTFSDSLAAEISSVSRDELMEAIQKQEEINLRLQDYIDRIIVAIMETNPAILEVKIH